MKHLFQAGNGAGETVRIIRSGGFAAFLSVDEKGCFLRSIAGNR